MRRLQRVPTGARRRAAIPLARAAAALAVPALLGLSTAAGARPPPPPSRPPPLAPFPVPLTAPAGAPATIPVAAPPLPLGRPEGAPAAADHAATPPSRPAPPVRTSRLALAGLMDRAVVGRDNGGVGHVIDVLVDRDGKPEALLVETGGFLGLGNRKIAVGWDETSFPENKPDGAVKLNMTPDEVRAAPAWAGNGPVTIAVGPAPLSPPGPPPVAPAPERLAQPAPARIAVPVASAPAPLASPRRARSR